MCPSVSAAQDHWQVCVKTGSGKQSGGKNFQLALGSVTLPAWLDGAVNTQNENQMLMRCSRGEAEEHTGILRPELYYPAQMGKSMSRK